MGLYKFCCTFHKLGGEMRSKSFKQGGIKLGKFKFFFMASLFLPQIFVVIIVIVVASKHAKNQGGSSGGGGGKGLHCRCHHRRRHRCHCQLGIVVEKNKCNANIHRKADL